MIDDRAVEFVRAVLTREGPQMSCSYERALHAARAQDDLPLDVAATIAIVALRYGPHGRLRAGRGVW